MNFLLNSNGSKIFAMWRGEYRSGSFRSSPLEMVTTYISSHNFTCLFFVSFAS